MTRNNGDWPPPPELPSYRVESGPEDVPTSVAERHAGTGLIRHPSPIPEHLIDADAAKVVRRLERSGFQAYLVGGCVRDLLLNGKPKDFDIATSARPEDVRGLFRNCRIIGRRFRLAHVLFGGGKIIEVATFRQNPQTEVPGDDDAAAAASAGDDLLIRNDNVFGEAHEDAIRRDFTINALFYDLDRKQVLDWCGGWEDIQRRTIHTIGNPSVRFREDPVRILRAVKFAARLDLGIDPEVYDAMVMHRDELARAARPRVFEEVLRLLRGGAAHRSMWLLWEMGMLAVLIPELAAFLDDADATEGGAQRFWKSLDAIDRRTKEAGRPLDDVVLFTTLLREPMEEVCNGARDRVEAAYEFLDGIVERIALPRRLADAMRRIVAMQPRLAAGRVGRVLKSELAATALDVLEIDRAARGLDLAVVEELRAHLPAEQQHVAVEPQPGGGLRRGAPFRRGRRPARR